MPRILLTGGTGQLAESLRAQAGARPVTPAGRPGFDFDHPETITATLDATRPTLVINAAAYTAVDAAETNRDAAFRANAEGPAAIAAWCAGHGAALIHVSTDYVFDGTKGAPYTEADTPNPIGVYGASKCAGEEAILATLPDALILRTSWVYAPHGRNFVRTMLAAATKHATLRVVADQHGCPTATDDLAAAIWALADRAGTWPETGIFHAAGAGSTTWHGLAEAIFEEAALHGLPRPAVTPIRTEDWPTPVRRPADSRLDCTRLATVFGLRLPDWRPSLARTVARLCADTAPA